MAERIETIDIIKQTGDLEAVVVSFLTELQYAHSEFVGLAAARALAALEDRKAALAA